MDSDPADLKVKWAAIKFAISIIMKSWVGIIMLTSDELALPALVKMLRDPKIPIHMQEMILEVISFLLEPVVSKVQYSTRSHRQEPYMASSATMKHGTPFRPSIQGPLTALDGSKYLFSVLICVFTDMYVASRNCVQFV